MNKTLIIFGAEDLESIEAEKIARNCNVTVAHATKNGERVKAYNAYNADDFIVIGGERHEQWDQILLFECTVEPRTHNHKIFDHHHPGDPGYSMGPAQFWVGSSIGQMCNHLGVFPSQQLLYVAAADHCPQHAYAGKCPGIDQKKFSEFRIKNIAEFNKISAIDASTQIHVAANKILNSEQVDGVYDLREHGIIEQLPEAAMIFGVAYIASAPAEEGIEKVVLGGCTTKDQVIEFLHKFKNNGWNVYGVPHRGYAGATRKIL